MAKILVSPYSSLYDDSQLVIKVINLGRNEKVTLQSCQTSDKGRHFHAYAYYLTDDNGNIDVSVDASFGGYYTGVEPLGLLWAMKIVPGPKRRFSSLIKQNVTKPAVILLNVYQGHIDIDKIGIKGVNKCLIVTSIFERRIMKSNIRRFIVEEDDLRGVIFVPQQQGSFMGVIDLGGVNGGMVEMRAALLSNYGFVVLCLSLFGAFDQMKQVSSVDLAYIERGIEYLLRHEKVLKEGVGVLGISFGGSVSLAAATFFENIKCVVNIGGALSASGFKDLIYGNKIWTPTEEKLNGHQVVDGIQRPSCMILTPKFLEMHKHFPEFQKSKASILFIYAEDDKCINWKEQSALARKLMKSSNKMNYEIKSYPGTGHMIGPPYDFIECTESEIFSGTTSQLYS
uniref:peroxisomal succinyl-coenzyme A thioesterase-like n=1 Tax=Styela clava TaxID=7725 RepID=UPI00193A8AEA|nr:peroxisomal succinyl-coenzyme A thioesterase-like [Styela clava]